MDDMQEELKMTIISLSVTRESYRDESRGHRPSSRIIDARRIEPPQPPCSMSIAWRIASWIERMRQRRALAELDDRLLQDIGITRYDAAFEAEKPFWR
jgi:uncharacterized protein YjiS (DUF1127 family)